MTTISRPAGGVGLDGVAREIKGASEVTEVPQILGVRRGAARLVREHAANAARATGTDPAAPDSRLTGDDRLDQAALFMQATLAGRLVELSAPRGAGAVLTAALHLVRGAQQHGEIAGWVTPAASTFFPPDAARAGVDLDALPILRVPAVRNVAQTAERLVRSGAFGLVVLDLTDAERQVRIPPALLNRLALLAREHDAAVIVLTCKPTSAPSLGALISLRVEARRTVTPDSVGTQDGVGRPNGGAYQLVLDILRDRTRPERRTHTLPVTPPEGVERLFGGHGERRACDPGP